MKTQRLAAMLAMTAAGLGAGQSAVTHRATVTVCMESDSHGNDMRALKMAVATNGTPGMRQAEAPKPESKIQVFVYNYDGVSSQTLAQAERTANRIYLYAGIKIQWLDCPLASKDADQFPDCQVVPGPTRLALRILSQSMADRVRQTDGSFAIMANVFSHDAEQLADRNGMRRGAMLGHLAAHELGHLLLGAGSHSSRGIMHVPWCVKELELITQGLMTFTPSEAERMRTNIQAREVTSRKLGVGIQRGSRCRRAIA